MDVPVAGARSEPPDPLPLRTNFSWAVAGNVVHAGSQFAMLVVLAKVLEPGAVGRFALALAITSPMVLLAGLNLRAVQATDAREDYAFGHYLALRVATTLLALLVIAAIALGFPARTGHVILLVGIAKAIEALSDIGYGLFQLRERLDRMGRSLLLRGPLALGALWWAVALTDSVAWGAAAMAAAWAAVLVAHDLPELRALLPRRGDMRPILAPGRLLQLAWVAAPLGVVLGLISLTANVPRYAIERYLGEDALGVFAAIAGLVVAGTTVVNAMGQAAAPRLAKWWATGRRREFRSLLGRLALSGLGLGAAGFALALAAGRPLLRVLYAAEYARLAVLLWVVAAATGAFVASFLGYGLTAARYFRPQVPLFLATAATATVASVLLVPGNGLEGAAQALLVASITQVGGSLLLLRRASRTGAAEPTGS